MTNKAKISVSQAEANKVLKDNLMEGEKKVYSDLVKILEDNFPEINASQCSGIINRSHAHKTNPILIYDKEDKTYRLSNSNNNLNGIKKINEKVNELLEEINQIPISEFNSAQDFEQYKSIQSTLKNLVK